MPLDIWDIKEENRMKNNNFFNLPNFHSLNINDPRTFLLEFKLFYRKYVNTIDAQKLKLFPSH
jgi:hypothetical protein